jgi:hypothetical protein
MWIWSIPPRSNDRLRFKRRDRQSKFVLRSSMLPSPDLCCTDQCWFTSTVMVRSKSVYCMGVVYWLNGGTYNWSSYLLSDLYVGSVGHRPTLTLFGQVTTNLLAFWSDSGAPQYKMPLGVNEIHCWTGTREQRQIRKLSRWSDPNIRPPFYISARSAVKRLFSSSVTWVGSKTIHKPVISPKDFLPCS